MNLSSIFQGQTLITCSSFLGCSSTWVIYVSIEKKEVEIFVLIPWRPETEQLLRWSFCETLWNCGTCRIAACRRWLCWCITGSCKWKNLSVWLSREEKQWNMCGVIQHVCFHHVIEEMHCLGILRLNRSKLAEDFFQVHWKSSPGS